jgi:hypothetical protein
MPKPPNAAVAHQGSVDTHGETVDLYNYTENTTERVPTWEATGSSPHSIAARVDIRTTSARRAADAGEAGDAAIDVRVYLKDDASGVSSIRDGGGHGASVIDPDQDGVGDDGADYRVLVNHDEGNGLKRLDCERID